MFSLPLDWAFCIYRVSRSPYFYSSPKQTNQKSPACVQPQATDATNHWNFNDDLAQFHNLQAMNQSFSKTLMYMAADHTIKMQPSAKQSSYNSYTFVNVSRWNAVLSELYLLQGCWIWLPHIVCRVFLFFWSLSLENVPACDRKCTFLSRPQTLGHTRGTSLSLLLSDSAAAAPEKELYLQQ